MRVSVSVWMAVVLGVVLSGRLPAGAADERPADEVAEVPAQAEGLEPLTWLETVRHTLLGDKIEVHGFASQGWMISTGNNFLTNTRRGGSFELTEFAINASTNLTDDVRIGAQMYLSKAGDTGNYMPKLDWAFVDWRPKDWLGFRAGRIKRPGGLWNDSRDLPFGRPWVLLPQGPYALGSRTLMTHVDGGSVYGDIPLDKAGDVSYEAYLGTILEFDMDGGNAKLFNDRGIPLRHWSSCVGGGDIKWQTPLEGLLLGASAMWVKFRIDHKIANSPIPMRAKSETDGLMEVYTYYARYTREKLTVSSEWQLMRVPFKGTPWLVAALGPVVSSPSWYLSATYDLTDKVQLGASYSTLIHNTNVNRHAVGNHQHDWAVSIGYSITDNIVVKGELHYIRGAGMQGLFPSSNPGPLDDEWVMGLVKLIVSF